MIHKLKIWLGNLIPKKIIEPRLAEFEMDVMYKAFEKDDPLLLIDRFSKNKQKLKIALTDYYFSLGNIDSVRPYISTNYLGIIIPNTSLGFNTTMGGGANKVLMWLIKEGLVDNNSKNISGVVNQLNADIVKVNLLSLVLAQKDNGTTFLGFLVSQSEEDKKVVRDMICGKMNGQEFLWEMMKDAAHPQKEEKNGNMEYCFKLAPTKNTLISLMDLGWISPEDVLDVHRENKNNRSIFFAQEVCVGDVLLEVVSVAESMILKREMILKNKTLKTTL